MEKTQKQKKNLSFQTFFPFLGLIFVLVLFTILTGGNLFSASSLRATLNDGLYIMLGTIGLTFLCAMGQLDFSIGYNMGVSCAVCCIAANTLGVYASIPVAILVGLALGLFNGLIVVKTKISPLVATIGTMFILQGFVLVVLNGSVLSAPLAMLDFFTNPLKITLLIVALVVGYIFLEKTKYGRIFKAIGACPEAVRQTGINADRYKLIGFIIMGGICGLLGFISLARTGSASNTTGSSLLFNCLCATLIGGVPMSGGATTKFRSAVLGVLTISFLVTGMTLMKIRSQDQQLIEGIIYLVAVGITFDRKNMKVIK